MYIVRLLRYKTIIENFNGNDLKVIMNEIEGIIHKYKAYQEFTIEILYVG